MNTKLSVALALTVFVVCSVSTAVIANETPANSKKVEVSSVNPQTCVLKISWDEGSPLNNEVIEALLESSGVWSRALTEVFGEEEAVQIQEDGYIGVSLAPLNKSRVKKVDGEFLTTIVGHLVIEIRTDSISTEKARLLLKRVCKLLNEAIVTFDESTIIGLHEQSRQYSAELERARVEVHKMLSQRQAFLETAQRSELDRERLVEELRELEEQNVNLEMARAIAEARRSAMQEQIARLSAEAAAKPVDHQAIEQLKKIVALRREGLRQEELLIERGRPPSEFPPAQVNLAQAELELARAQESARRTQLELMGVNFVAEMNRNLTDMAIDEADQEAQHAFVQGRLERTRAALKVSQEYEQLGGNRLEFARLRLDMAERNLADLRHKMSTTSRPTMTVIGAN